jgi:hypothetical protein
VIQLENGQVCFALVFGQLGPSFELYANLYLIRDLVSRFWALRTGVTRLIPVCDILYPLYDLCTNLCAYRLQDLRKTRQRYASLHGHLLHRAVSG